jgi:predicted metal-dependent phosphoesterase TrpH
MSNTPTEIQAAQATLDALQLEQQTNTRQLADAADAGDIDGQLSLERRAAELPRRISLQQARVFRLANERDRARLPELEAAFNEAAERSLRAREVKEEGARLAQISAGESYNTRQELLAARQDIATRAREIARLEGEARLPRAGAVLRSAMPAA